MSISIRPAFWGMVRLGVEKASAGIRQSGIGRLAGLNPQTPLKRAQTDGLTGLYNKDFLLAQLPIQISQAIRGGHSLSVAFFDGDGFKSINDIYGHEIGDIVIREIGKLAQECFRAADVKSRFGGDEFVVVLYGTNISKAWQVAERFRKSIEAKLSKNVFHACEAIEAYTGRKIGENIWKLREQIFTVSIGIAQLRDKDRETQESLLARADQALYLAKQGGRNRIFIDESQSP